MIPLKQYMFIHCSIFFCYPFFLCVTFMSFCCYHCKNIVLMSLFRFAGHHFCSLFFVGTSRYVERKKRFLFTFYHLVTLTSLMVKISLLFIIHNGPFSFINFLIVFFIGMFEIYPFYLL